MNTIRREFLSSVPVREAGFTLPIDNKPGSIAVQASDTSEHVSMKTIIYLALTLIATSVITYVALSNKAPIGDAEGAVPHVNAEPTNHTSAAETPQLKTSPLKNLSRGFSKATARTELNRILAIQIASVRDSELHTLYQRWIELDPYDAIAYIHQFSIEEFKDLLYTTALGVWSNDNTLAFDNWLMDSEPDLRFVVALETLVVDESTPEEFAIEWVAYIADIATSEESRQKVLDRWVVKDPVGAIHWSLKTDKNKLVLRELFETMTRINPEHTFVNLALLDAEEQNIIIDVLNGVRNFLAFENINQDILFAIQLLPSKIRQLTLMMVMPRLARGDNPAEIGLMIEALPDNYTRTVMLESLAYIWAKEDPEAAGQFALTLPKSDRQAQVISGVVAQWHMQDLPAASDWLNSVRGSATSTDMAAHHLASHAAIDPEYVNLATTWVNRIENPKVRATTTKDVVANWFNHDEESAAKFLKDQGLFTPEKLAWFIEDQKTNKTLNERLEKETNAGKTKQ